MRTFQDAGESPASAVGRSGGTGTEVVHSLGPHGLEQEVRRELLAHSGLQFSSLVVRRVQDGVCLEGVVDGGEGLPDVCRVVQRVAGVRKVLNHLLVQQSGRPPAAREPEAAPEPPAAPVIG